jgi:uncharacterized membrane protein
MTKKLISFGGWAIVIAASFYFLYNNALHYFAYNSADYSPAGFWPHFAPWLLIHIIGGMVALVLGPFQFISSLRKKHPLIHRTTGKIYLVSILIGAVASLYLSINKVIVNENDLVFGSGLAGLALAWLVTSGMAYWAVRSKNFVQHREWMVRSFVVTCGFTSFRLLDRILTEQFHTDPSATGNIMSWACWAVPLMVTEVFLQGIKIRKGNIAMNNKKTDSGKNPVT